MNIISAYQCIICGKLGTDELEMKLHESSCIAQKEYTENKAHAQECAREYLDSFRKKSRSVQGLFEHIKNEMDDILEAVRVIKYYDDREIEIKSLHHFSFERAGFGSSSKLVQIPLTHSSPVGKPKCKWSNDEKVFAEGFTIRANFVLGETGYFVNFLDMIGGINTGTGGHGGITGGYYITFWPEDFPLGLK